MAMLGVPLSTYKEELHKIPLGILPTRTIEDYLLRLAPFPEEMECLARQYDVFDPFKQCSQLPREFYEHCSFEELCKIYGSSIFQLRHEQYELFEKEPEYAIVRKIKSSLWRYGYTSLDTEWNTLVDAYNGIRNFTFGLPDFEVRLNYTVGHSAFSVSEFDPDVYLDAVFGFIVHYKGEPVMTIGFSFAQGRKLLISQVQMKKHKGNRFLYKLPVDRVVFVTALMKKNFPGFRHYLVDGARLVDRYIDEYRTGIEREQAHREPSRDWITKAEAKILKYQSEVGEQIRRTYRLPAGPWKLSLRQSVEMHHRHYFRIVRA